MIIIDPTIISLVAEVYLGIMYLGIVPCLSKSPYKISRRVFVKRSSSVRRLLRSRLRFGELRMLRVILVLNIYKLPRRTREDLTDPVDLMLDELRRRLADKQISITLTEAAKDAVIEQGFDPNYGARPLKRYIQSRIETLLARKMIGGEIFPDSTVTIDFDGSAYTLSSERNRQ